MRAPIRKITAWYPAHQRLLRFASDPKAALAFLLAFTGDKFLLAREHGLN
jgi:hypothetical protein